MRKMLGLPAGGLALTLLLTACGDSAASPGTVRGVVLEVRGDLESVESFVLRTDGGEVLELTPAPDGNFRFPLQHLHDHRRTLEPVLVELDRSVDPPLATAIQDADGPSWHTDSTTEPSTIPPSHDEDAGADHHAGSEDVLDDEEGNHHTADADHDDEEGERDTAPSTTALTTTSPPPTTESSPDNIPGSVIEMVITDGNLEGGARRESVALGETVTLRVSGNTRNEVHVHGYDLYLDLVGGAGELTFEASIPGVFEIELEGSHILLVRLEVS